MTFPIDGTAGPTIYALHAAPTLFSLDQALKLAVPSYPSTPLALTFL